LLISFVIFNTAAMLFERLEPFVHCINHTALRDDVTRRPKHLSYNEGLISTDDRLKGVKYSSKTLPGVFHGFMWPLINHRVCNLPELE